METGGARGQLYVHNIGRTWVTKRHHGGDGGDEEGGGLL